jgi:hypothetical protein
MTKEEYLKICSEHWDKFERLKDSKNFHELEVNVVSSGRLLMKDILQATVGEAPSDRRKKKR